MRTKMFSLCFIFASSLICSSGVANADTSLDEIANFADRICNNIPLEGSGSAVELNGQAKAELKGLLKKIGNVGIGGTGKYEETAWSGVLQKDIANILQKNVDCKLKIVELLKDRITSPAQDSSKPHADNAGENKKSSSGNLVVNGDFSAHWSEGWQKDDRNEGAFLVETINKSNDPSNKQLHLRLDGTGVGVVQQKIQLPEGKGVKNLFVEFDMKVATETTGLNLGEPIEAFFGVQMMDKDGNNLGQINFSAGKKDAFENTGMYGVIGSLKSTDSRCMLNVSPDYHTTKEKIYNRYMDCFSGGSVNNISTIYLFAYTRILIKAQHADIWLDNIKLYYKN